MKYEYRICQSNGVWYGQQFDSCRRLTAHAKLNTLEQLAQWIAEMENYENYAGDTKDNNKPDISSSIDYNHVYSYSYNSIIS